MYFTVNGNPRPQIRHKYRRVGNFIKTYDPSSEDKKVLYKKVVEFAPAKPFLASLMVQLVFYMKRPKFHFRTGKYSHLISPNAPKFHIVTPDCDNMAKLTLDVLENAKFYKNDSQICQLQVEKIYCELGEKPRTEIHIEQLH